MEINSTANENGLSNANNQPKSNILDDAAKLKLIEQVKMRKIFILNS